MLATETLYTPYNGAVLLENPLLNKGLAFTHGERSAFNLQGLLPHNVETIEEQTARAWGQFCQFKRDISRHIYLRNIQDTNETLFYNLLRSHMKETLPKDGCGAAAKKSDGSRNVNSAAAGFKHGSATAQFAFRVNLRGLGCAIERGG